MLDDIEDADHTDDQLTRKLSELLRSKLGVGLFNRLRDRLEECGSDDRIITLAIITEVCDNILNNRPTCIVTRDTATRLSVEVVGHDLIHELRTHGRLLDGPLF